MYQLAAVNWETALTPSSVNFIAFFGSIAVVCIAGTLSGAWQKVKQHEREVQLKRDLAARGYSVDEIERIVRVKPGKGWFGKD